MGCGSSISHAVNNIEMNKSMNKTTIQISEEVLSRYIELEQSINESEKKHVLENYQIKTEQLEKLEQAEKFVENDKKAILVQTDQLKKQLNLNEANSAKDCLMLINFNVDSLSREEEKLLDSLNQKEILEQEFMNIHQQKTNLKQEVEQLVTEGEKIQQLYQQRDELLDSIFEGQYASETENQLEKELDWLLEQKHHVDQAHLRWTQAHSMVKQANIQLSQALQRLNNLLEKTNDNKEKYFDMIIEARNDLVSASQNLQGAQRYLPNIKLPYCTTDEVETLDKAISFIFTDMQSKERQEHAFECYHTTYKRAGALRQWLEQVLNSTIARDLFELTEGCKARGNELRAERIRLIKKRIKDVTGKDVEFEEHNQNDLRVNLLDSGVDSELEDTAAADEQIAQIFEAGNHDRKNGAKSLTPDHTKMPLILPTPMPPSDLAPMPSDDQIFGKIEQLRNKHKKEIQEFQRTQRLNQARIAQGLKAKLHARRSRRSRMEMHQRELEALRESPVQ